MNLLKCENQKAKIWDLSGGEEAITILGNVLYRSFYMDFFNIHIWIIEQLKWNDVEVR